VTEREFRELCLSFPETEEGTSYGHPAYKAFGKFLTRLRTADNSVVIGCVGFDEREIMMEADPRTFHLTDHYRNYPMVLARLDRMKKPELRELLERQWRKNAPKRWLKAWEAGGET